MFSLWFGGHKTKYITSTLHFHSRLTYSLIFMLYVSIAFLYLYHDSNLDCWSKSNFWLFISLIYCLDLSDDGSTVKEPLLIFQCWKDLVSPYYPIFYIITVIQLSIDLFYENDYKDFRYFYLFIGPFLFLKLQLI